MFDWVLIMPVTMIPDLFLQTTPFLNGFLTEVSVDALSLFCWVYNPLSANPTK